jgi:hypothetical protein
MKNAAIFILAIVTHFSCLAQIAAGDIAFVGYNADNPDQFTIITTNYLEDGTQIYFSDAGWTGSALYASEGAIIWTVPTGGVPANTMVTFTGGTAGGFTIFGSGLLESGVSVSSGSITSSETTSSMAFSTNGDQIMAFTGSIASPTFIACVNFNGSWSWTGTNSAEQTQTPPGLTAGTNCLVISDRDNGKIDCLLLPDPATVSDYNNSAYWINNDATRYTLPPTLGTCEFLLPLELISFSGYNVGAKNVLTWATENEINVDKFQIERSSDGVNFSAIGEINATNQGEHGGVVYQFIDDDQLFEDMYYRLNIIDADLSFTYSDIIAINKQFENAVSIFPNPVNQSAIVHCDGINTNTILRIYTSTGEFVCEPEINTRGQNVITMNTNNLPHGLYLLQVFNNGKSTSIPFIK